MIALSGFVSACARALVDEVVYKSGSGEVRFVEGLARLVRVSEARGQRERAVQHTSDRERRIAGYIINRQRQNEHTTRQRAESESVLQ